MALSEIDSFFFKLRHLLISEKDSRSRRQERRAAARKQAAEEAEKSHGKVDKVSEPVEVEKAAGKVNSSEKVAVTKDVTDEFCSNTEYSESESKEIYSFKSDFPEEDIENSLDKIFKNTDITSTKIILRDQLRPMSAEYLYTLELKIKKGSFSWPQMSSSQMEVFRNLKRIF